MKPDSIVFDLDGTLWDTCEACAVAWNNVVAREGIPFRTISADDVRKVTGHPHEDCIRLTFEGVAEEQVRLLVSETMTEDNLMIERIGGVIYPEVESGLRALRQHFRLFIVSNCQSGYIETFLRLSGFGDLFEDFECWGDTGKPKPENLHRVIERNGLKAPVMVGDAEGDEQAARACGIPFGFVEYGFRGCVSPDYRFASFGELTRHFISVAD